MDADWHDEMTSRAVMRDEVERVLRKRCSPGVDIDAVHKRPYIPAGCNQQGRIEPAEACTDLGACGNVGGENMPATSADMKWLYACIAVPIVLIAAAAVIGWLV